MARSLSANCSIKSEPGAWNTAFFYRRRATQVPAALKLVSLHLGDALAALTPSSPATLDGELGLSAPDRFKGVWNFLLLTNVDLSTGTKAASECRERNRAIGSCRGCKRGQRCEFIQD
jgi:hypothetical protein